MAQEILQKGAEANLSQEEDPEGPVMIKDRVAKGYRAPQLDAKIRKERTRIEARLLREASRAGVLTPRVIEEKGTILKIEFLQGVRVKEALSHKNFQEICSKIGEAVARLHNYGIIHGDLTTSNMILINGKLALIDFGLGFSSKNVEDKAVDLHLLHEALRATHFEFAEDAWAAVLESYKKVFEGAPEIITRLEKIEARGRYK